MYIENNDLQYPCSGFKQSSNSVRLVVDEVPLPITGVISLYADNGFSLVNGINSADYSRHLYENGTLVLTNEPEPETPSVEEIKASKIFELSAATRESIVAGVDVETAYGVEHFSLADHDQTNITNLSILVRGGASGYPYHADGKACVMYSAADLDNIATAAWQHITYMTTYNNFLYQWIKRETDPSIIQNIAFGDELPADLAADMTALLATVNEV
jgi:hypothetical protein